MPEQDIRRLAVILFADIAGYTSMMEADEKEAINCIQKFKQAINHYVDVYQGELVQYYGDGCLVIFSNALNAVNCAKELQHNFLTSPTVPVRIGLHLGDVLLKEGNVYGDAVNIASRIESIGVPGSVLLSRSIHNQLKNKIELQFQHLGAFEFKNVKEPIRVYALREEGLAQPNRNEITGKLKAKPQGKIISGFFIFIGLFLIIALIFFKPKIFPENQLPEDVLTSRLVVLPFENNTNDTTLNVLGNMAADWISRNLINFSNTKVVQFDNVLNHLELIDQPTNEFSQLTGAEKMIKGRFFQEGTDLIFESKIIDLFSKEVDFAFPNISGNKAKPSALIDDLCQHIIGYFASREDQMAQLYLGAPNYESFSLFEQGMKFFGRDYKKTRQYFERAISVDSNFITPKLLYVFTYSNEERFAEVDSIFQKMNLNYSRLPRIERFYLDYLSALNEGDHEKAFNVAEEWFQIDPKNFALNYLLGNAAKKTNRPQKVIEACKHLDPSKFEFDSEVKLWWFWNYSVAYMQLGKFDEALELLHHIPSKVSSAFIIKGRIFARQNRQDSLENLLLSMELRGIDEDHVLYFMNRIASEFAVSGNKVKQIEWAQRAINRINDRPESTKLNRLRLANSYFIAEVYDKSLMHYNTLVKEDGRQDLFLLRIACVHAKLGNRVKAMNIIQEFKDKVNKYSHGKYKYCQALIYSFLGEKENAMTLLIQAYQEGYEFKHHSRYNFDLELIPLHGYGPYEAFVSPKD